MPSVKYFLLSAVVAICILCGSLYVHAQTGKNPPIMAKFAMVNTHDNVIRGYDSLLSDPRLVTTLPGYKISGFTISFIPSGKDYLGPFYVKGGKCSDQVINVLKKMKEQGITQVKVLVEDIKVLDTQGQTRSLASIILTIKTN